MERIKWIDFKNPKQIQQLPLYQRTAGYDPETGEAYLSAAMFGGEGRNFLCMSYDGIPLLINNGHLYCPASWLKNEFPKWVDDIDELVSKIKGATNGDN